VWYIWWKDQRLFKPTHDTGVFVGFIFKQKLIENTIDFLKNKFHFVVECFFIQVP